MAFPDFFFFFFIFELRRLKKSVSVFIFFSITVLRYKKTVPTEKFQIFKHSANNGN